MSLAEATRLAINILQEVMEEKLTNSNVQVATVVPEKGFSIFSEAELANIIQSA